MAQHGKKNNSSATARLTQDYVRLKRDPVPYIVAEPLHANILQWHYVVKGPEDSPYEGGYYHGKLVFPREFPFKPPSIYMITPSGRCIVNSRLCLSISDFHPDTWNPAWSVATILTGLLSFMLEKSPTLGSIETSDYAKRQLAVQSGAFNLKDTTFCELFPDLVKEIQENICQREAELASAASARMALNAKSSGVHGLGANNGAGPNGLLHNAVTNVIVIIGFAAFAYTVKQILMSIMDE
jgi:ubiquitin-conjugating enzyme E2 J2